MKALITGGLGQIGSHIAEMMLERGDEVLVIDNLATGRPEHLADHPRLQVVIDTIADRELMTGLVSKFRPDAVVHAACSYKDPDDWYNDTLTNCVGGSNIVDAAKFGIDMISSTLPTFSINFMNFIEKWWKSWEE